jgi:hypothetical protein
LDFLLDFLEDFFEAFLDDFLLLDLFRFLDLPYFDLGFDNVDLSDEICVMIFIISVGLIFEVR